MDDRILLLKTMEEKYLERLLADGECLFRPTSFFRELEAEDPRSDPDDNHPDIKTLIPEGVVVDFGGSQHTNTFLQIGGLQMVMCWTGISSGNHGDFLSSNDIRKFGDSVVAVRDVEELAARLQREIKGELKRGFVRYVLRAELDAMSVVDPFVKHETYQAEYEYRFSYFGTRDAVVVTVGSIEDIATIVPMAELEDFASAFFLESVAS